MVTDVNPHVGAEPMVPGWRYLLCSDGLTDMVPLDKIEAAMRETEAEAVASLLSAALAAGGRRQYFPHRRSSRRGDISSLRGICPMNDQRTRVEPPPLLETRREDAAGLAVTRREGEATGGRSASGTPRPFELPPLLADNGVVYGERLQSRGAEASLHLVLDANDQPFVLKIYHQGAPKQEILERLRGIGFPARQPDLRLWRFSGRLLGAAGMDARGQPTRHDRQRRAAACRGRR